MCGWWETATLSQPYRMVQNFSQLATSGKGLFFYGLQISSNSSVLDVSKIWFNPSSHVSADLLLRDLVRNELFTEQIKELKRFEHIKEREPNKHNEKYSEIL